MFKDVQIQQQQKSQFTSASYSSKNIDENRNKSTIED